MKRSTFRSAFFNPRVLIALLLCAAGAGLTSSGTLLALSQHEAPGRAQRTLTLQERVLYQRAIEEVYWRHRIWPKENANRKPSLDAVMSQAQLEKKVKDYLRNSQALEDYWQRPITAEQLQAEMDRMATHTKQSEVLQELFEALGNDPFVITECLARPALAERLLTNWYAYDQRIHGELKQLAETELQTYASVQQMKQLSGKYSEIEFVKSDGARNETNRNAEHSVKLNSSEWDEIVQKLAVTFNKSESQSSNGRDGSVSRPSRSARPAIPPYQTLSVRKLSSLQENESRYYLMAVIKKTNDHLKLAIVSWLKKPLQSWLTKAENQFSTAMAVPASNYALPTILGGGCTEDTWTATPGPPDGRAYHTAVWTGSEMIVFGGAGHYPYLNTGGRYNPSTDSWAATTTTNAIARGFHTGVWTGNEMIVWGGLNDNSLLNSGGRYNPTTESWIPTAITNAPGARDFHTAVWTGSKMIVWGGSDGGYLNTGGRYDPNTDSWSATSTTNVPAARNLHTAVWTGSEMIVWGGYGSALFNTGGRYNPVTNSWTATSATNAPGVRYSHTAVWTGTTMIIWGGYDGNHLSTGAKYDPSTNSWTATSTANVPDGRKNHTAVWTGSEMIVWGGSSEDNFGELNTGGRYNPTSNSWTPTTTVNAPAARNYPTAVWTGSEMIVWGGNAGLFNAVVFNTGGRYSPGANSWVNTGNNNAPLGRNSHTAVWTGSEMIVWGGEGEEFPALDTGGKYGPATDTWTATSTTDAPAGRGFHTAVWTGSEMMVWGGVDENSLLLNTGGKYDPISDGWTVTTTANAPAARIIPTAVWTGSEMIVWGGQDENFDRTNTGGRYNPGTDSWTATSITNAPDARDLHTAIWTGSEMIIWGGQDQNFDPLNTGGIYDPDTDSWMPTNSTNAPSLRKTHTAIWSGNEMIVWGGYDATDYLNTGGRYNPDTDSWTTTSTTNPPDGRTSHTAVWTGNDMIVWGGAGWGPIYFATGGNYNPEADTWTDTSIINAPGARDSHTAVWTGSEMIVWGGGPGALVSGGSRYCARSVPTPTPTPCTGRCSPTPRPRPTPAPRPMPP
jgi:N-acetylneuraminic acid mutarotase